MSPNSLSLTQVFDLLFPDGPADAAVLAELAPKGWERSKLVRIAHPTFWQVLKKPALRKLKTYGKPAQPKPECAEIVGQCLRELFAEHEVVAPFEIEFSTWRGTSREIADWINRKLHVDHYDYMDFYMGAAFSGERADLTPVFKLVLRRFKDHQMDLQYNYPLWYVAHTGGTRKEYLKYKAKLKTTNANIRKEIDKGSPPDVVAAYTSVFGKPPEVPKD